MQISFYNKLKNLISSLTAKGETISVESEGFRIQDFDHLSPDVVQDPYPYYEAMRDKGPVHFIEKYGFWMVIDYDEVVEILKQHDRFSSQLEDSLDNVLVGKDPPEHTQVRKILTPLFSLSAMPDLESFIKQKCEELLENAKQNEHFDIVSQYAIPLTEMVMGHIMGFEKQEIETLRKITAKDRYTIGYLNEVNEFLADYLKNPEALPDSVLARKLLSSGFNQSDVLTLLRIKWVAGTATTGLLVSSSCNLLLHQQNVFDEIKSKSNLLLQFMEEVLRFESPAIATWRIVTTDTILGGSHIPKNSRVRICISAANRDPKHYDQASVFDLHRNPRDHLAFGTGIHACLGSTIARTEAKIALETLINRFPNMRAAEPLESATYAISDHFRALEKLLIMPS